MQGMSFLILDKNDRPINHGVIVERITAEKYLCQFTRTPSVCRVINLEEIQRWNLFPNDEEMNKLISTIEKNTPKAKQKPDESKTADRLDIGPSTEVKGNDKK